MHTPPHCPHCGGPVAVEFAETGENPSWATYVPTKWDCKNQCWENDREGFIADLREWETSR